MTVTPPRAVLLLLLSLLTLAASVHGGYPPLYHHFCGFTGNFTTSSTYAASLSTLLTSVAAAAAAADYGFYSLSTGRSPDAANAIALCQGDVTAADYRSCLTESAAKIARRCPVQKEAILLGDYCMR